MLLRQYELMDHGTLTHLQVNEMADLLKSKAESYNGEYQAMLMEGPRQPVGTKLQFIGSTTTCLPLSPMRNGTRETYADYQLRMHRTYA